jgi:hypothetical protein
MTEIVRVHIETGDGDYRVPWPEATALPQAGELITWRAIEWQIVCRTWDLQESDTVSCLIVVLHVKRVYQ